MIYDGITRNAVFSPCRRYRYTLHRIWELAVPPVMFIGLNPSTADETRDDPTVRRCMRYAKDWGHGGLIMTNIFAYRSTNPKVLETLDDPVGPENDWYLLTTHGKVTVAVAAWGAGGGIKNRDYEVKKLLGKLYCLGVTSKGKPKHPLYLPKNLSIVMYCDLDGEYGRTQKKEN